MAASVDPATLAFLIGSVLIQLAAALVAMGQMRLVGRYRFAWLTISLALTLMVQRRVAALMTLMQGGVDQFTSALVGLLISLLMLIGVLGLGALFAHMRRQERELVRLATTDVLTQAHNRRHVLELAKQELVRQQRTGRPLSLLVLDLDHFKRVNDTYGHATGDAVLVSFTQACRDSLRAMDILGRLGGEEFLIALPETDEAQAVVSCERLREHIALLDIPCPAGTVHISASIGIAVSVTRAANPDTALAELMHRADMAMYAAKSAGRNRCMLWRPEMEDRQDAPSGFAAITTP